MQRVLSKIGNSLAEKGLMGTVRWLWNCAVYQSGQLGPTPWPDYKRFKLDKAAKQHLHHKTGRSVFIFAEFPYYDAAGGHRAAQLARAMNSKGFAVYYYYRSKSRDFRPENNMDIPCACHMQMKALSVSDFGRLVSRDDLMLMEYSDDALLAYAECAKERGAKVVFDQAGCGNVPAEALLEHCDLLAGCGERLTAQLQAVCGSEMTVLNLPNGVNDEQFAHKLGFERPEDMVQGEKILLYYGGMLNDSLDWDLVFELARRIPGVSVNLIGGEPPAEIMGAAPEAVHFLGQKRHTQLPAYLKHADFAVLPLKAEAAAAAPPLLYEAIAMGKNVLTVPLPDAADCPNLLVGTTTEAWCAAIERAAEPDLAAADAFVGANTWNSRIEPILDAVYPEELPRCDEDFYGKVSVVVLNYNNKNIIDKCVATLLRCNDRYGCEIVVVDNQSKDGSYEQLRERFGDRINLVRNSKNGCSSGRNLGVKVSKGEYILFLDSDQWVTGKYWLDPYFEIYRAAPNFGAVGWASGWFDREGKAAHIAFSEPHKYMPPVGLFRSDIGYLATCGMMMERKLFEEIDGFDEFYDPTCYEDTDLSLKIRHAGRELYYSCGLGVMHLPHQTTKDGSAGHSKLMHEKQQYFTAKWRKLNPGLLDYIR